MKSPRDNILSTVTNSTNRSRALGGVARVSFKFGESEFDRVKISTIVPIVRKWRGRFLKILAVLALSAGASAVRGQDLVVYGTTPGGIALAVRAAREGKDVLLVGPSKRLGGMFSYGLGAFDCLYTGSRAPIFDEFRDAIFRHYGDTYGWDSEQVKISYSTNTRVESKVAEQLRRRWWLARSALP